MSRTMNQIVMLNHAAWVNSKRMDARMKKDKDAEPDGDDPVVWHGKRLSEMTTDEWQMYYSEGV